MQYIECFISASIIIIITIITIFWRVPEVESGLCEQLKL